MQTISEVEKAISLNQELLQATKKRIGETSKKLSESKDNVNRITAEIVTLKEKRQAALARGIDAKAMNDSLKKLESELELETEKVTGLESFLAELRQEEASLHLKLSELPKRILQLKSVELAKKYNELSGQLAEVAKGLNAVHFKIDNSGNNGKANRVVFLPEDYINAVPRAFFDSEGLVLGDYVEKYKGRYHSNIHCPDCEKYFYKWDAHKQRLIEQKTD